MDPTMFLLELLESKECKEIEYKRLAIRMYMGIYYSHKPKIGRIDSFMIPFVMKIKYGLEQRKVNIDELVSCMLDSDTSGCTYFALTTWFKYKEGLSFEKICSLISKHKVITPYIDSVDVDSLALIVANYIFDNLTSRKLDIESIVKHELFSYKTKYGLTKVNGAEFKMDGLIFDNKGYYYNIFTNKTLLNQNDLIPGFVKLIYDYAGDCDILYRLDERLSMPASEYDDYTGLTHAKYRGPQFNFHSLSFNNTKTITVHFDSNTNDKLLLVVKKDFDTTKNEDFLHIELEALPNKKSSKGYQITTFLHGMYYPQKDIFTHIDYTKNQYTADEYILKFSDSNNGVPIDHYTKTKELHYKIWCIENGCFSKELWYKLMAISLEPKYKTLLDEMLN